MRLHNRLKITIGARDHIGVVMALCAKVIEGLLIAAVPITAMYCLIEQHRTGDYWQPLYINIAMFSGLFLSRKVIAWPAMRVLYQLAFSYGLKQREFILRHLISLPLGAFKKLHRGKIVQALTEDVANLETYYSYISPQRINSITVIASLFLATFFLAWGMALAAGLVFLLGLVCLIYFKKNLSKGLLHRSDAMAEASKHVIEFAQGMPIIRISRSTGAASRDFDNSVTILREGFRKAIYQNAPISTMILALLTTSVAVGAAVGILMFDGSEEAILIDFIAALVLLTSIIVPARSLIATSTLSALTNISHNNLEQIENIACLPDGENNLAPQGFDITYRQVNFSYEEGEQKAVRDISFEAAEGSVTAIVGKSGAGKSTLMHLLMRFWDVQSGSILLNNIDIRDYQIEILLNKISTVFQETILFNDTVMNNIRIGRLAATDNQVIEAAKSAQIFDFIKTLPGGMHTEIGVGGSKLSGGEKQRIAIARAILKDAPIVILDEATSALDPENENAIQAAFSHLAENKTVFIIAHRLATILNADNILVLDEGRMVDQGSHEQLIITSPIYKSLWDHHNRIGNWHIK